jgi:ferredoxin, 2Fe-2S
MAQVTFIGFDSETWEGEGANGTTVMELARTLGVDGIVAECGGACACATCQVVLDEGWFAIVGPPNPDEAEMLNMAEHTSPTSRLSCQIRLSDALDGLQVRTPLQQG